MRKYTRIEIKKVDMVTEGSLLLSSIKVQNIKVEVDEYQAKPEETFEFNLDSFGDTPKE